MEIIDRLSNQGWHITKEGLDLLTSNCGTADFKTIINTALDADFKDIGKPVLSSELHKSKIQQIQKVKNIAAPKSNEDSQAAPRMLKLILTDGYTYCQGLEVEPISFLSQSKTAPGMKLLVKGASITSGYIFLQPNTCSLLGGKVAALYDKWEVSKSLLKHSRGSYDGDGPPPWVNFGQKILSSLDIQSFKSLDNKSKDQTRQNSNFDVQRQDAIAEAASGAVTKVFGGGVKQSIQVQENRKANFDQNRSNQERERNNGRRTRRDVINDEERPQKPSEKVSLFDFLEDKLGSTDTGNNNRNLLSNKYVGGTPNDCGVDGSQNKAPRFQHPNASNYNSNYKNYRQTSKSNSSNTYASYNPDMPQNIHSNNLPDGFVQNKHNSSNVQQFRNVPPANHKNNQNVPNMLSLSNNMERMSVNSQFASRSLKQHLNLGTRASNTTGDAVSSTQKQFEKGAFKNSEPTNTWQWKIGDLCMAKYWEDNKYYNATVTAITNRTCVVQFSEYGNYEEVLHCDCIPVMTEGQSSRSMGKNSSGSVEFRRGGNRSYVNNKNFYKSRGDK